ncbi:MAG TPA: hypothetical protein DCY88_08575 [Cyanobacteria bacterium UBA11372]|nr:hypothetical protein [Cyanobacteria bacterium UBA11372]
MAFFENVELAFADDDTRESYAKFRKQYPWATYDDWWNAQAAAISGNEEWHPANDPEFMQRGSRYRGGSGYSDESDRRSGYSHTEIRTRRRV